MVKEIKRNTHRKFNSEERIRIILEGLRGEVSIANISRKEGIVPSIYFKWSKAFLEVGKQQLNGDTIREASGNEVSDFRNENEQLKKLVVELSLKSRVFLKKFEWSGVSVERYMSRKQL